MHGDVFNYVRVERDQTCPADNSDALTPHQSTHTTHLVALW